MDLLPSSGKKAAAALPAEAAPGGGRARLRLLGKLSGRA